MNLIITHENGDFDALAAVVAAARLFPGSLVLMPEPLQANVRSFVNLYRDLLPLSDPREIDDQIDSVIVIDTNRRERLGKWENLLDQAKKITVFDHHPGDQDLGADQAIIEAVGATTTILLEEIRRQSLPLSEFEVTLFALGIYEDTGSLTYAVTTVRDVRAVAFLWEKGISTKLIQEYLRSPLNEMQKDLLEKLIHNSELYELNQRRVLISSTVLDEYVSGASVLLQLLDEIEDAGLTIVIIQMTDSIYLAARSRDEDLNLLELLAPFDVRGYPGAVSAHFKGVEAGEVKEQMVEFLKHYLPPAITAGQVASSPVLTINSDISLNKADEILSEHSFSGSPVTEAGKLVGIISRRDLRKGIRNDLGHAPVKGFMTRQLITANTGKSLNEIRRLMVDHNIGRVPILDENGKMAGIVTRSDILRHLNDLDRKGRSLKKKPGLSGGLSSGGVNDGINADADYSIQALISGELPARFQELLQQVSRLAEKEGIAVFLVGGIIRDLLLKYPLEKDLDFVVIGDAVAFAFSLQKVVGGNLKHYEQFGTASLSLSDGLRLDLVTARKEFYSSPAALPTVERSSLKNDLFRRDFTINTMACSLAMENYGQLYDYYNGRADLQNKIIRALYQLSFVDDPLRILRGVRFEQRYNFTIEPETFEMIWKAVEKKVLARVSRQRLNHELKLIYREPSPVQILRRFEELQLFSFLYPGVNTDESVWKLLSGIEDILCWAEERKWDKKPDPELAYLSGLLFGLESAERSAIIRKLNLSRERSSTVITACREALPVLEKLRATELKPSKIVSYLEHLPVEAYMLVYALAENEEVKDLLKLYMGRLRHVKPKLKGSDLKKLGLKPGPYYRNIMGKLKKAVLDGKLRSAQEELDYVMKYLEADKKEEE
jgi:tRNA nucleotidyltransferase (CCA-adding enzyme)